MWFLALFAYFILLSVPSHSSAPTQKPTFAPSSAAPPVQWVLSQFNMACSQACQNLSLSCTTSMWPTTSAAMLSILTTSPYPIVIGAGQIPPSSSISITSGSLSNVNDPELDYGGSNTIYYGGKLVTGS